MNTWRVLLAIILGIAAVAAIALGAIYVVTPAHSLPSFMPGHSSGVGHYALAKHTHRGYAGIVVGVVLLICCVLVAVTGRRRRTSW
jgi:amino acid transporter